jgi:hypothetical protein
LGVIDVRLRGLLFSVVAGCLSGGLLCLPQDNPNSTPPPARDEDVIYTRSGGLAGVHHEVRITPDGQVFVSDNFSGEKSGVLSEAQSNHLNAALADWDSIPSITEEPICCDGFGYGITYHGRTLSWNDFQSDVPDGLGAIAGVMWSVEQGV